MTVAAPADAPHEPALVGWLYAAAAFCLSLPTAPLTTTFSLLVIGCVATARVGRLRAALRAEPVLVLSLALFAWIGLRTVGGEATAGEAFGAWFEYHELLALPLLAAAALDARRRDRALAAFVLGSLAGAAVSYARVLGVVPELPPPMNFAPPRGPIGGAWLLSLAAFACLVRALGAQGKARIAQIAAAIVLLGVVMFLTAGRTAWLSVLLLSAVLLASLDRRRAIAGAVALAMAVALAWSVSPFMRQRVLEVFERPSDSLLVNSAAIRVEFYRVSAQLVLDAPLLGHGTGSFRDAYARKAAAMHSPGVATDNPHNQFLLLAIETGLAGALAFVALLAAAWRAARRADAERALLMRGLAVTMASSCLFNSFLLDGAEGRAFVLLLALALPLPAAGATAGQTT